jgi:hypothetical protein
LTETAPPPGVTAPAQSAPMAPPASTVKPVAKPAAIPVGKPAARPTTKPAAKPGTDNKPALKPRKLCWKDGRLDVCP